jgi:hypothetical protein
MKKNWSLISFAWHSAYDADKGAFIVYNELNGEERYQTGKDDAKFVKGYYFTPSEMKRDYLYLRAQAA